jgi:hypothetical protein
MSARLLVLGLAAAFILDGSCALLDLGALTVSSWSPAELTLSSVTGAVIQIRFCRAVNPTLTEEAFSITADGAALAGRVSWPDAATLLFTPDEPLQDFVLYAMHVSTLAEDEKGRDLAREFDHSFTTRTDTTRPAVASCLPADHAAISDVLSPVVVTFSEAMDHASVIAAFTLSPAVGGCLRLSGDGTTLTFTPSEDMLWQTAYTVTVRTRATDAQRNALGADFTSHFYTGTDSTPPGVSAVRSASAGITLTADDPLDSVLTVATGWEATDGLVVTFSEPVLTSTAIGAVSFSPKVQTRIAECNTRLTPTLSCSFTERLAYGTTYTVTIGPGIPDAQGARSTGRHVYHFTVDGPATRPPAVARVFSPATPGDPSTNIELHAYDPISLPVSGDTFFDLYIDLAVGASLDPLVMAGAFSVSATNGAADFTPFAVQSGPAQVNPPVSGPAEVVERVWVHVTNQGASGEVKLRLSTALKDSGGNMLAVDFILPLNDPD